MLNGIMSAKQARNINSYSSLDSCGVMLEIMTNINKLSRKGNRFTIEKGETKKESLFNQIVEHEDIIRKQLTDLGYVYIRRSYKPEQCLLFKIEQIVIYWGHDRKYFLEPVVKDDTLNDLSWGELTEVIYFINLQIMSHLDGEHYKNKFTVSLYEGELSRNFKKHFELINPMLIQKGYSFNEKELS